MSTATPVPRPQYASASLYVGDLHPDITEAVLYEFFNSVGPVASIRICRDSSTRRSLGYAYVNYHSVADAERALSNLNYTTIKGIPCRIMWCHRDPALRKSGNGNLFVKNLDKSLDNKALYDSFSFFGNILSCKVATDETGKSRGFGFVHFESEEAARLAIERVNNVKLGNKNVFVGRFQRNTERPSDRETRVTNLYVKNFPVGWTETELKPVFEEFGTVTSMCVEEDKKKRKFAFINFEDPSAANRAVEELHGRRVTDTSIMSKEEHAAATLASEKADTTDSTQAEESGEPKNKNTDSEFKEKDALLYVQRAQSKAERNSLLRSKFEQTTQQNRQKYEGVNLYIKNLSDDVNDEQLRQMFIEFGTISSAKVMVDGKNKSLGFGFVCFATPDEATRAISEMHLKQVGHKPLYVGLAEKREQRIARLQQRYRSTQMRTMAGEGENFVGANYYPNGPMIMNQTVQNMPMGMWPAQGDVNMAAAAAMGGPRNMMNVWKQGMYGMNQPPVARMMPPPRGMAPRRYNPGFQQGGGYRNPHPTAMSGYQGGPSPMPSMGQANSGGNYTNQPSVQQYKQVLGEQLFPLIAKHEPHLAAKITGMMLEMENSELTRLLHSEAKLKDKIAEALEVLEKAKGAEKAAGII